APQPAQFGRLRASQAGPQAPQPGAEPGVISTQPGQDLCQSGRIWSEARFFQACQARKEERAQEIMEVQQEISLEKNMEKIGQTFKVLIDKKEAGRYLGRTEFDSVEVDNEVIVQSKKKLPIGEFVQVKITKAYDYDIEGEVAE
ncbi:MAG TPA: TRAM domain-containing protein, partial [Ferruginibacter sp.]|nr:TRAM domain-containing protein [Ferruginibacter sp.]